MAMVNKMGGGTARPYTRRRRRPPAVGRYPAVHWQTVRPPGVGAAHPARRASARRFKSGVRQRAASATLTGACSHNRRGGLAHRGAAPHQTRRRRRVVGWERPRPCRWRGAARPSPPSGGDQPGGIAHEFVSSNVFQVCNSSAGETTLLLFSVGFACHVVCVKNVGDKMSIRKPWASPPRRPRGRRRPLRLTQHDATRRSALL